jgi:hypothetical protein
VNTVLIVITIALLIISSMKMIIVIREGDTKVKKTGKLQACSMSIEDIKSSFPLQDGSEQVLYHVYIANELPNGDLGYQLVQSPMPSGLTSLKDVNTWIREMIRESERLSNSRSIIRWQLSVIIWLPFFLAPPTVLKLQGDPLRIDQQPIVLTGKKAD